MSDYRKIAPRYGTNGDMKALIDDVHARGMHILLDLVPGHTSIEHPWFKASAQSDKGPLAGRYIWTNTKEEADDPDLTAENREKLADYPGAGRGGKYYLITMTSSLRSTTALPIRQSPGRVRRIPLRRSRHARN